MIARSDISTWTRGTHGSTFGGNPVACAAALATIQLLEEGLVADAAEIGNYLKERLAHVQTGYPEIGAVRGLGLMIGVEFVQPAADGAPDAKRRDEVVQKCFEKGLLLLGCGEATIRFCPPLIVTREHVDTGVAIFDSAVREALSRSLS
jgi:4-aminobutyrate aminotransferase